jgi:hypothetical protein
MNWKKKSPPLGGRASPETDEKKIDVYPGTRTTNQLCQQSNVGRGSRARKNRLSDLAFNPKESPPKGRASEDNTTGNAAPDEVNPTTFRTPVDQRGHQAARGNESMQMHLGISEWGARR